MTKELSKEIDQYFKQIRNLFPMYRKEERLFLSQLKSSVEDFAEDKPECTLDDIVQRFEDPQTVVHNYLSALDIDDLCKKISLRKYILRAIVVLLLLTTIYTGYKMLLFYDVYLEAKDAIIHTEVTIIE